MKNLLTLLLTMILLLNAQSLFEIKDASDNTVLEVSADGLRIFNMGDTLMVISSTEIKAFIDDSAEDKALSRSFSVSTATSSKGASDVISIESDGFRVYNAGDKLMDITGNNITAYIDSSADKALSRSFSVSTATSSKDGFDILDVTTETTSMREGTEGNRYTDFSENNIFLGLNAGENSLTTAVDNVFLGNQSGFTNNLGSYNVFIGKEAGFKNYGDGDYLDGQYNVFLGYKTGYENTSGSCNVFLGEEAGRENTDGMHNIYIGTETGRDNIEGTGNTCIGSDCFWGGSGNYNTYLGYLAGQHATGSSNVFLGINAGSSSGSLSNVLYIDNSDTNSPLIYGEFGNDLVRVNGLFNVTGNVVTDSMVIVKTLEIADMGNTSLGFEGDIIPYSSVNFDLGNNTATEHWDDVVASSFVTYVAKDTKNYAKSIDSGLNKILQLRPITFTKNRQRFGLIPAEVEKIIPEVVVSQDIDTDLVTGKAMITETEKGMNYNELIPVLIKSIQEQQAIIEQQQVAIDEIRIQNEKLTIEINKLK